MVIRRCTSDWGRRPGEITVDQDRLISVEVQLQRQPGFFTGVTGSSP
jgi:hypothetical protein